MTLDGHIKTGLAASILLLVKLPEADLGISASILPYVVFAFAIGNIGPDFTEFGGMRHRTHTHYPWYYIGFISVAHQLLLPLELIGEYATFIWILIGYSAGCLTHIVCDIPYGKIPYLLPKRPVTLCRIPFDSVLNRVVEHTVVAVLIVVALASPDAAVYFFQSQDLSAPFLAAHP